MVTEIAKRFEIEYPIFAFSHCRDVVAAVTKAGGLGVLGAQRFSADELELTMEWLDSELGGRPYGVDVLFPVGGDDPRSRSELESAIPAEHREFVEDLTARFQIPPPAVPGAPSLAPLAEGPMATHGRARELVDVVFSHDVPLLVSALGPAPSDVVAAAHDRGMLVGGMVGAPRHALKHVRAGADVVIAQGMEAAGHTGEISTMVLIPQVVDAVPGVPVLAAGGVSTGQQMAAAMALGAEGVWCGSVWLTTAESDVDPIVKRRIMESESTDAVRTRVHTGKPNRTLNSDWIEAWKEPGAPEPLPMPLQAMLQRDVMVSAWEHRVPTVMNDGVGQVIGQIGSEQTCRDVVYRIVSDFVESAAALGKMMDSG